MSRTPTVLAGSAWRCGIGSRVDPQQRVIGGVPVKMSSRQVMTGRWDGFRAGVLVVS